MSTSERNSHNYTHIRHISTAQGFPLFFSTFLMHFLSSFLSSFSMSLHFPYLKKPSTNKTIALRHTYSKDKCENEQKGKKEPRAKRKRTDFKSKQNKNLKIPLKMLNRRTLRMWFEYDQLHANMPQTHTDRQTEAALLWLNGFGPELTQQPHELPCILTLPSHWVFVCESPYISHTHQHVMPNSHSLVTWEKSARPSFRHN